jgi:hypothetical protein
MNKNHIQARIKVLGPLASKKRGEETLTLESGGGRRNEARGEGGIPLHPYLTGG